VSDLWLPPTKRPLPLLLMSVLLLRPPQYLKPPKLLMVATPPTLHQHSLHFNNHPLYPPSPHIQPTIQVNTRVCPRRRTFQQIPPSQRNIGRVDPITRAYLLRSPLISGPSRSSRPWPLHLPGVLLPHLVAQSRLPHHPNNDKRTVDGMMLLPSGLRLEVLSL
jgi:hypothetical protein